MSIDIEHIGDNAIGRLCDFEIKIKLLIGIGISSAERKIAARPIKTLDIKHGIQRPVGKRKIAVERYFRLQPENILTKMQVSYIKAIDIDRQRQLRQAET
ncbi:hypothetical protein D3C87_1751530 [compost metagenome]